MKSNLLSTLSILAVMASFLVIPVNTFAGGMAFTVAGVFAMLCADYGRVIEPLKPVASVVAFEAPANGPAAVRRAA